jgi:hypothetical protein
MTTEEIDDDDDRDSDATEPGKRRHDPAAEAGGCYIREEIEGQTIVRYSEAFLAQDEGEERYRQEELESARIERIHEAENEIREAYAKDLTQELRWTNPDHDPQRQEDPPGESGGQWSACVEGPSLDGGEGPSEDARGTVEESDREVRLDDLATEFGSRKGCIVKDRWAVLLGDCREFFPAIQIVDHVICDPPYSDLVHSKSRGGFYLMGNGKKTTNREREFGFAHLDAATRRTVAAEISRCVRRWVLAFSDVESVHLWKRDLEAFGLEHVRVGAWLKEGGTPQFSGDRPGVGFEAIEIAHPRRPKRWNRGGYPAIWSHPVVQRRGAAVNDRVHTAQKPETLMLDLVRDFTSPNALILDPFAGSGTTGVAALRLGRRAILIEKDEKYAELCVDRMTAEEQSSTFQARRAGQMSLLERVEVR